MAMRFLPWHKKRPERVAWGSVRFWQAEENKMSPPVILWADEMTISLGNDVVYLKKGPVLPTSDRA
jgi:hypothetical protein